MAWCSQGTFLQFKIGVDVDLYKVDVLVPEPVVIVPPLIGVPGVWSRVSFPMRAGGHEAAAWI